MSTVLSTYGIAVTALADTSTSAAVTATAIAIAIYHIERPDVALSLLSLAAPNNLSQPSAQPAAKGLTPAPTPHLIY